LWPSIIERESTRSIPTTLRPLSEEIFGPISEEAPSIPSRPVSGLASLPMWGQTAVLSAGVAALFFAIPLVARWVWSLRLIFVALLIAGSMARAISREEASRPDSDR